MIEGIQFILTVLTGGYLMMAFASVLTLSYKYKNYKETFLLLSQYKLVQNDKRYILLTNKEEVSKYGNRSFLYNNEIYYDKKDTSIKLNDGYIFNSSMLYFDLYSLYWYHKLKKEFFRKTMTLAELREEKLNKLLR